MPIEPQILPAFEGPAASLGPIQQLEHDAEAGHGLNLAFFPVVDAAGAFFGAPDLGWTSERCVEAAGKLLQRFLEGHRFSQAHAQHL